jgi:hypothetical protein
MMTYKWSGGKEWSASYSGCFTPIERSLTSDYIVEWVELFGNSGQEKNPNSPTANGSVVHTPVPHILRYHEFRLLEAFQLHPPY